MNKLAVVTTGDRHIFDPNLVPVLFANAGDHASRRFIEFFTATIRNPNTRQAYARAVYALPIGVRDATLNAYSSTRSWLRPMQQDYSPRIIRNHGLNP